MCLKQNLFSCILFFVLVLAKSQPSESSVITKVDSKDLTNSFVTALFQDQKGYLWVGTIAGLNKYTGYNFIKYRSFQGDTTTLSNPAISCIYQTDAAHMMIGTFGGLNIYNFNTDNFRRVKMDSSLSNISKKVHISCIVSNKLNEKVIGTQDGVLKYNEKSNKLEAINYGIYTLLEGWNVQSLCYDHSGNLWAGVKKNVNGTIFSRVFKYDVVKKHLIEIAPKVSSKAGHSGISEDYLGYIWLGVDDGLVRLDPQSYAQIYYKVPGFHSNVSYMHSKDNIIWQSYWSYGLTAFDLDKKQFTVFKNDPDNPKSLISNKCWSLCKDDNDILWIGTDVGLEKLTNRRPSLEVIKRNFQEHKNSFISNRISSVLASKIHTNLIFAGIDGEGFSIYNKISKTCQNYGPNATNKNSERFVNHFLENENGDVYIVGQSNFQKVSLLGNKIAVKSYFKHEEHFCATVVQDPLTKYNLWIGGEGEICLFNKQSQTCKFFKQPGGVKSIFFSSFSYQSHLYFTYHSGILKLDPTNSNMKFTPLPDAGDIMNSLVINDSTVLLSSQYLGLLKYYPNKGKYDVVFKSKNEYFSEISSFILYRNSVWLGSNHGLIKWDLSTNEITEIKTHDGLPSETIHQLDIYGSHLYIATQEGLAIIEPDHKVSRLNLPKTEITELSGIVDSLSIKNISNNEEIILNETQNSFKVSFTLLDFSLPEKNTFKYRLLPQEKEWQNLQAAHSINFNALPPGKYKFEVIGANTDQLWSAEPFAIIIKIIPPFYKTTWFYYLVGCLVLFLTAIIIYARFKSNIRKQALLERIIKERTAEIQEQRIELLDSINYAERIQKAIFVGKDILARELPDSFIYDQPKDKVSGDFYWIGKHKDLLIVFVGDCTGHGVPGAMLSIVGTSLLNKIVYEQNICFPGEILTRLNQLFYNQLNLKDGSSRDGMDASVVVMNMVNNTAYFSSAKNNGFYIANNNLVELKAQRSSIGEDENVTFSTTTLPYIPNRHFYFLTDGIKDQFGGVQKKRLSSKRLKQILLQASEMSMSEQKNFIYQTVNIWKAGVPQTDDMMVIGFKF